MEAQDSSDEDEVEKEVAYLAKNFCRFLKFKRDGKSFEKGKFSNFKKDKKDFKKDSKDSSPSPAVTCFKCKGHGHVKKECPTYLKAKGKVFANTLSDSNGSNSDLEESCDGEGNYSTFMDIAPVDSLEDLSLLVEELGEVLAYQKPLSDRSGLGYTGESSSSANVSKEMKFVKAKEPLVLTPLVENVKVERNQMW